MVRATPPSTRRHAKSPVRRLTQTSCALCQDKVEWVDYKNVALLRRYMSDRGKIRARAVTGNCVRHQGEVSVAIKTARELVLLPRGDTNRSADHADSAHRAHRADRADRADKPTTSEPLEMAGATRGGRS